MAVNSAFYIEASRVMVSVLPHGKFFWHRNTQSLLTCAFARVGNKYISNGGVTIHYTKIHGVMIGCIGCWKFWEKFLMA